MIIFDGHNDTLLQLYRPEPGQERSFFESSPYGAIDLPRARQGGLSGGLFAIFTPAPSTFPPPAPLATVTFTENGYVTALPAPLDQAYAETFTNEVIDFAYRLEREADGAVRVILGCDELDNYLPRSVLALVLHLEGAEAIQPDLSNLQHFYDRGIRSIGVVWSRPNAFGNGVPFNFPHSPDTGDGLTGAGKALVRACNDLGIVVDLAHLNEKGFWDAASLSAAPLVVSHADVYAICPFSRNLTDAQIDAVGASGGVIGINFETLATHPQSSDQRDVPLTQITAHIDYVVSRIGIDHVAFGSDFDGAAMPNDLSDASKLPNLIQTLRDGGYDEDALEKIAYRNWLRVLKATWKD